MVWGLAPPDINNFNEVIAIKTLEKLTKGTEQRT